MNTLETLEITPILPIDQLEATMGNYPTTNHCVRYGCTGACEDSVSEGEIIQATLETQDTVNENAETKPQSFTCCDRCTSEAFCEDEGSCQSTTQTRHVEGITSLLMPQLLEVSVQP